MEAKLIKDPKSFWKQTRDYYLHEEGQNSVPIGVVDILMNKSQVYPDFKTVIVFDGALVELAAVITHPFNLLLAQGSKGSLQVLAEYFEFLECDLPGVAGPQEQVDQFFEIYRDLKGVQKKSEMGLKNFQLKKVLDFGKAKGSMRVAKSADSEILEQWSYDFAIEGKLPTPHVARSREQARRKISEGNLFVWESPEGIVSMAGIGGRTPSGVRIGPVYTPPPHRKKGYAKTLTAHLSHECFGRGLKYCFITADADNPTSNKIYQEIGYTWIGDYKEYCFSLAR